LSCHSALRSNRIGGLYGAHVALNVKRPVQPAEVPGCGRQENWTYTCVTA
jgi:hypothetical protein